MKTKFNFFISLKHKMVYFLPKTKTKYFLVFLRFFDFLIFCFKVPIPDVEVLLVLEEHVEVPVRLEDGV